MVRNILLVLALTRRHNILILAEIRSPFFGDERDPFAVLANELVSPADFIMEFLDGWASFVPIKAKIGMETNSCKHFLLD